MMETYGNREIWEGAWKVGTQKKSRNSTHLQKHACIDPWTGHKWYTFCFCDFLRNFVSVSRFFVLVSRSILVSFPAHFGQLLSIIGPRL